MTLCQAKRQLERADLGHDVRRLVCILQLEAVLLNMTQYGPTPGDAEFLRLAATVMFGEDCKALTAGRVCSSLFLVKFPIIRFMKAV